MTASLYACAFHWQPLTIILTEQYYLADLNGLTEAWSLHLA